MLITQTVYFKSQEWFQHDDKSMVRANIKIVVDDRIDSTFSRVINWRYRYYSPHDNHYHLLNTHVLESTFEAAWDKL